MTTEKTFLYGVSVLLCLCAAVAHGETNFAFRARLLDVHPARQVAADAAPVAADETAVDSAWRIVPISNGPVLAHAARDLKEYLGKWRIENGECKIAEGLIEISVDNSLKELQAKIEVGEKKIRITGATLREKMTASKEAAG